MITVLGAAGFIGSHLVSHLQRAGAELHAPGREESLRGRDLGHIIYCVGLTGDFRERPYDAVDAHVSKLLELVRHSRFESILYLSSARVYLHHEGVAREDDALRFHPLRSDDLYSLSKGLGESIVLSLGTRGRVVRLSNVYGAGQTGSFLSTILEEANQRGTITLRSALQAARDYVSVTDVASLLEKMALRGKERIYNVASGEPITNAELVEAIARLTGCSVTVAPDASPAALPRIDTGRIRAEFGFRPARVLDDLPSLAGERR